MPRLRPPLWSSGQSSWLQIQRSELYSRRHHIFWEVVGLERGPLSLMSTTEDLLGRNSSGSGAESREFGRGDPLLWPRDTLYQQTLTLTLSTSGGRSVGKVRSWTKATESFIPRLRCSSMRRHVVFEMNTLTPSSGFSTRRRQNVPQKY
jgi:hypothetical protein